MLELNLTKERVESLINTALNKYTETTNLAILIMALARDWLEMYDYINESPRVCDIPRYSGPIIIADKLEFEEKDDGGFKRSI
jgi:hypothetical protein